MKTIPLKYKIDSLVNVKSYLLDLEDAFEQELSKLSKADLCIYLASNNKFMRDLAKMLYDSEKLDTPRFKPFQNDL